MAYKLERRKQTVIVCRWHDSVQRKSYRLHKKLLNLISEFGKTMGYSQYSEIEGILYTNNEISETEIRGNNPLWYSNKKNKVPSNKPNQGGKRPVLGKLHNIEERN